MKEKQSRDSWFVKPFGLFLLLLLAVMAVYVHAWMVGAFLCFLFLLCFSSSIWSGAVLKRVDFQVEPVQACCYAGERLRLNMQVRNRSFLPLVWLDVILPIGKKIILRQEGQQEVGQYELSVMAEPQYGLRDRFVWLLWQQEILWEEELVTLQRGLVSMEGALLQAGDGFGLSAKKAWKAYRAPFSLAVYPGIVPVTVKAFLKITQEAAAQNRGQTEDITILKSSRPYQPGDPMKRINWRLFAGSGRMETNIYEKVMPGCAAFVLDLESFCREIRNPDAPESSYPEKQFLERDFEAMLSFLASCMKAVTEQGLSTALIVPAYGSKEASFCLPEEEKEAALRKSMEVLAALDYQKQQVRFPYEEFWRVSHKLGNVYLCTRTEEEAHLGELAFELGRSRARFLVLKHGKAESGEYDCLCAEDMALESLYEKKEAEGGSGG